MATLGQRRKGGEGNLPPLVQGGGGLEVGIKGGSVPVLLLFPPSSFPIRPLVTSPASAPAPSTFHLPTLKQTSARLTLPLYPFRPREFPALYHTRCSLHPSSLLPCILAVATTLSSIVVDLFTCPTCLPQLLVTPSPPRPCLSRCRANPSISLSQPASRFRTDVQRSHRRAPDRVSIPPQCHPSHPAAMLGAPLATMIAQTVELTALIFST